MRVGVAVAVPVAVDVGVAVAPELDMEVFVAVGVGVGVFATASGVHCICRLKLPVRRFLYVVASMVYASADNERTIRELRPLPPSSSDVRREPPVPIPDRRYRYVSCPAVRSI